MSFRWMLLKRKKKMEPLIKYKAWTEEQRAAIESRESEMNRGRSRGSGTGRGTADRRRRIEKR